MHDKWSNDYQVQGKQQICTPPTHAPRLDATTVPTSACPCFLLPAFRFSVPQQQTNQTWNRERAALDLFRESKGEVLLMAVMRDVRNVPGDPEFAAAAATATASGDQCGGVSMDDSGRVSTKSDVTEPTGPAPSQRDSGSKVGSAGRVSGTSADSRAEGRGGGGGGSHGNPFVHASIFPGENFSFVWHCNVLVLAEDKEKALFHLGQLQAKVWRAYVRCKARKRYHALFMRCSLLIFRLDNGESSIAEPCVY